MTDYSKLVAALQNNDWSDACPCCDEAMCKDADCIILQAADAIEALEKQIDSIENEKTNLEADIINLEIALDKVNTQLSDAAKRNAELHAELEKWVSAAEKAGEPKRGEWLEREVIHDIADARITDWQQAKCSVCKKWHTTPYLYYFDDYNYCPNCGAKMEVQE